jgi:hypothetical protein
MADLELTSSIHIENNVLDSYLIFPLDGVLTGVIRIVSKFKGGFLKEAKCINCKFNNEKIKIKYSPRCFRNARLKDENFITNCLMFKRIK